jgi:putative transcriptional regulator
MHPDPNPLVTAVFCTHHENMTISTQNLTGQLLIAMPGMGDPRFEHSVIYICAHSHSETMGLIINKPLPDIGFSELLKQLDLPATQSTPKMPVQYGGPVEKQRGFVLHSLDYRSGRDTVVVNEQLGLTASLEVLSEIAQGHGPSQAILTLGYAGWGAGQIEQEMADNAWLSCAATPELVMDTENDAKWSAALQSMGINPLLLSADAGHA